jgi:hypothetical protein
MSNESLLYHYQGIRSRFLEADAHLDDVLIEATNDSAAELTAQRLERARTLALAAYDDYTLVRKRLMASFLSAPTITK